MQENIQNIFHLQASNGITLHIIKKIENIARVLCDLDAHIVGLQEIESESALRDLINTVKNNNCRNYKYYAIVKDSKEIPIRPAIVSVFPY